MIKPDDILKRAERKYREVLKAWLLDEDFTPIEFAVGTLSKDLAERRQQIDSLREHSKETLGTGYCLRWDTVNSQALGKQTLPCLVIIESLADYLGLLRKQSEFNQFVMDVHKIRQAFPLLESWMQVHPQKVIEYRGKWDDLLAVCDYFAKHPRPNVYSRELPIAVHTKFTEMYQHILRDLLDTLLPAEIINPNESSFILRYGLKEKPALVRVRLLEDQLQWQYGLHIDDLTLPVHQAASLFAEHIKPQRVIIVENLINFLTLPKISNGAGIFGGGFAIHLLKDIAWLNQCDVIYWGDIDAHGFEILSDLRELFPHVCSIMMDHETLEAHKKYVVQGMKSRSERLAYLTPSETLLAQEVIAHNWRLEQEHIPYEYVLHRIKCFLG